MTREELKEHCKKQIENCEMWAKHNGEEPHGKVYEEHKLILELLEQKPTTKNDLGVDCISRETVFDFKVKLDKWMFHNHEDVCGQRMIDIDYLDGEIWELFQELGIVRYDDDGNLIDNVEDGEMDKELMEKLF